MSASIAGNGGTGIGGNPIAGGGGALTPIAPVSILGNASGSTAIPTAIPLDSTTMEINGSGALAATGNFSGNISLSGTAVLGTGITGAVGGASAGPAIVINTPSIDYSTFSGNIRNNQFTTTLAPSVNTTNIWENNYSAVVLNGPGVSTGEINAGHAYVQVNSGGSFQTGEVFETSIFNNGGTINSIGNVTALFDNSATGTVTSALGFSGSLTNSNTTAGAIATYKFLSLSPMAGGGSTPTNYYFLANGDANANSSLLGKFCIGAVGVGQAICLIKGGDTSVSTWLFDLENSAGTHLMLMRDDGSCAVSGAWTFSSTALFDGAVTLPSIEIVGGTAPTGTVGTGAGGGGTVAVTGNQNSHVVTVVTGTTPAANAVIALINVGGTSTTDGPNPTISPGNANAAGLGADVWGASSGTGKVYTLNSTTALIASTTYVFNITALNA